MIRKVLIGGLTAATIVGAGTVALATTGAPAPSGGSTSSTWQPSAEKHGAKHGARKLLRHALHAEAVIKTKKQGLVTVHLIRGTVSAVSATSISVLAEDKTTETYSVTKDTKVRARTAGQGKTKGSDSTIGAVKTGDNVVVMGTGTSTLTAKRVVDIAKK